MKSKLTRIDLKHSAVDKFIIITSVVETVYKLHIGELITNKNSNQSIVEPRYVAMNLLKEFTSNKFRSYPNSYIGCLFGSFDHATVNHAIKTVSNMNETNKDFKIRYQEIKAACQQEIARRISLNDFF